MKLPKAHRDIIMAVGAEQETFATQAARLDDQVVAQVYGHAGAKVYDIDDATLRKWQTIAKATAWKDYAEHNDTCKALITAAQNVHRTNEPVAISPHARCGTLSSAIETFWRWECSRASNSRPLWLNFQRQAVALEFQDRAAADPCAYIRWSCR